MLKTVDPESARLVWFRDDLRTGDNPALAAAIAAGGAERGAAKCGADRGVGGHTSL